MTEATAAVPEATPAPAAPTTAAKDDYRPQNYRYFGVSDSRPVEIAEVEKGYRHFKLFHRNATFMVLVVVATAVMWTQSNRLLQAFEELSQQASERYEVLGEALSSLETDVIVLLSITTLFIAGVVSYFLSSTPVYLVDFSVLQPDDSLKISKEFFMNRTRKVGFFTKENEDFQEKILHRSGLGEETYFPPGITFDPLRLSMDSAREEFMTVITGTLDELFAKTGVKPRDIDLLVVNCSLFNPTPSLSAMVINKYKLRSDVKNYNLAGMGCSAGVISIDLAKDLLQVHRNSNCLVISTENITQNWYKGNERDMLVSNTIFRMGGAAILLSNKPKFASRAKYQLLHTVRVHKGASDEAMNSVYQCEDPSGVVGVRLSKELIKTVGDALKTNLTILGPLVLPFSEQFKFFVNLVQRKGLKRKIKPYTPDFRKAVQHYCIHAGGRAVIDGLEQNLQLKPEHVLPSRATLYRVGNTSSSSVWYELAFIEYTGTVRKGDRVWQIAFGSGFKCNSAVWKALKANHDRSKDAFWANLDGLPKECLEVLQRYRQNKK